MSDDKPDSEQQAEATGPASETGNRGGRGSKTLERLEQELAEETKISGELRQTLDKLNAKLTQLETGFDKRLAEAEARAEDSEAKLAEQRRRLEALGSGREETMRALGAARDELARMAIERDELRKQLERIDGMQTETITLPDDDKEEDEEPQIHEALPSIEELMASLSAIDEATGTAHEVSHLHTKVEASEDNSQEMISPQLVFPENFGSEQAGRQEPDASSLARVSKVLVLLDAEPPIKYPLYKDVMTLGRGELADIQIASDYVSRVHARVLSTEAGVLIEDVHSKNGIRVNKKMVERHQLRHGDVITFGKLHFTFIDTDTVGES